MENIVYYNSRKADPTNVWLLFLFLGWSYGSLGQGGIQVLYYLAPLILIPLTIASGGFAVVGFLWPIIRLFTLSHAIKNYNRKVAAECGLTKEEAGSLGLL